MCEQSELTTAGEGLIRCKEAKRQRCEASIVKLFPLSGEGLRERVLLEGRPLKLTEVRKTGSQAIFIYRYLGKTGPKFIIDNSFSSMHLSIFASDLTSPLPSPCKGEGAACHCEGAMHVAQSHNIRRAAFTLAEVLITLGIIGVVAAMTIPTLMTKYQHKVRETEFKKAYSVLQQALYSIDPDMISAWTSNAGDRDTEFCTELYSKYRVITDEDVTDLYKDKKNQFAIKNYNKKEGYMNQCAQLPTRIAADGSAISGCYNCFASWLVIDTNGPKRAPNALGHDIFYFSFNKNKLVPVGSPDYSHWEMKPNSTYCSKNSTNVRNGASCAYFAVANICPDDSSKTYWECLP